MREQYPHMLPKQMECSFEHALDLNVKGYGVYYYPNGVSKEAYERIPANPDTGRKQFIKAHDIDTFEYVFADFDMKQGGYASKDEFIGAVSSILPPSMILDSGNGVHSYWKVSDLDAMSYLKLSRRLCRSLNTDPAVSQLKQLMRVPGTVNTKDPENGRLCEILYRDETALYTCEQLDAALPQLTLEDAEYCQQHYDNAYKLDSKANSVDEKLPAKFCKLLASNSEVKAIWSGDTDDRSRSDHRLGHLLFAGGFTKAEAMSVLVNCAKALSRAPMHRIGYAQSIVEKIWTFEEQVDSPLNLSSSVADILSKSGDEITGTRFPCWKYLDDTEKGFKLGQVIGLVAGSGVGKTSVALNMFQGFVQFNPDYEHFFISLEQPKREIAERWATMCGANTRLHDKVHIIDNYEYDEHGDIKDFRDLSLQTIKEYLIKFQASTGKKAGCVVVDHIGVLANNDKMGQDEGVKKLCKQMKAFASQTNTMLVMQSQTSREKAGIGDLELNKDAAFGTSTFENYCDYLITLWQPLKRCYDEGAPTVCAYKFCKIRHKRPKDVIREDRRYAVIYDGDSECLRELMQDEETSFDFFKTQAANLRKQDRKTEVVPYKSVKWETISGV